MDVNVLLKILACELRSPSGRLKRMPNQRHKKKTFLGGYVSKNLKKEFAKLARKEAGGNAKRMLLKLIQEGLERRGVKVHDEEE